MDSENAGPGMRDANRQASLRSRPWAVLYGPVLLAGLFWCGPDQAAAQDGTARGESACQLPLLATRQGERIIDARTLALKQGGTLRLAGLDIPAADAARAISDAARGRLAQLLLGRPLALHGESKGKAARAALPRDRHGNVLAHVRVNHSGSDIWVQGELLSLGLARAISFKDNHACMSAMVAREAQARAARRGIWALKEFAVRQAGDVEALLADVQTYQIVEGRILSNGQTRRRIFLNFGTVWRQDSTGIIEMRDLGRFEAGGIRPEALKGKHVRLRGWIERRGGPAIQLTHPEQIELVETR